MTTQLATTTPRITKPQIMQPPASGKAIVALFPPEKEGGQPTQAICRFTPAGTLRAIAVPIKINPAKGETFVLKAKVGDDWVTQHSLTAIAYDRLNSVAGVTFFSLPERLIDNEGKQRPNPWIEQDAHGEIHFVRVAQVGFGRSATGNLVAHALSVTYDLRTYLAQDLWSKWQGKKGYQQKAATPSKDWGVLAAPGMPSPSPNHSLPFHIPAGVVLWCDYSSPDVQAIIGEHINRQKFAERNAITICRRNILKKILGVSKLDASMTVQVTGYIQEDRDLLAMGIAVAAAQAGEIVVDGQPMTVEREDMGVVSEQEIDESLAGEDDEISGGGQLDGPDMEDDGVAPSAPVQPIDPNAATRAKIRKLVSDLGPAGDEVLARLEIEGLAEIGRTGSADMLRDALAALEAEQLRQAQTRAQPKNAGKDKLFEEPRKPTGPI